MPELIVIGRGGESRDRGNSHSFLRQIYAHASAALAKFAKMFARGVRFLRDRLLRRAVPVSAPCLKQEKAE